MKAWHNLLPMRILVCPDKFAGTLSASEAANCISKGWLSFAPDAEISQIPISDGGTGFLDSISHALNLETQVMFARGPLGAQVPVEIAFDKNTSYIESAQVIGIHLIQPSAGTILKASSFGIGEVIKVCVEKGFHKIIIGLGGTAVSDGGAGALAALGAVALDSKGMPIHALENGTSDLKDISSIDLSRVEELLSDVTIEILTDVDNPLLGVRGAAKTFSAQKGASELQIEEIESSLTCFATLLGKRSDGKNAAVALGAGAAGGVGFGLIRVGAVRSAGIERVIEILGLKSAIANSDLVITGEGKFDWQSLDGKVVAGVAKTALNLGKATLVMAGQVELGRRDWQTIGVAGAFSMAEFSGLALAMSEPIETLAGLSERVARTWNR